MTEKQVKIYNDIVEWWEAAECTTPRDMYTYQFGYIDALMDHGIISYEDMVAIERELHQAWYRKLEDMGIYLNGNRS